MANTGYLGWTGLRRWNPALNGGAGGYEYKTNAQADPDYVAPVLNEGACPVDTSPDPVVTQITLFSASPNSLPEGGGNVTFSASTAESLDVNTVLTLSNGATITIPSGNNTGTSAPTMVTATAEVSITAIDNPNVTDPLGKKAQVNVSLPQEQGYIGITAAEFMEVNGTHAVKVKMYRISSNAGSALSGEVKIKKNSSEDVVTITYNIPAGATEWTPGARTFAYSNGDSLQARVDSVNHLSYSKGDPLQVTLVTSFSF